MADAVQLRKIDPQNPKDARNCNCDVVFIHGLGGDWDTTWRAKNAVSWPQMAAAAHPNAQIWSLSYPAKIGDLVKRGADQDGIEDLATLATERFLTSKIGERPCVFVCHSLGGLLAKRILIEAAKVHQDVQRRFKHEGVKAVMFCGTPHRGSAIANVLNTLDGVKNLTIKHVMPYLGWGNPALVNVVAGWAADKVLTTSVLIEELAKNNVDLQHLNEDFGRYYQSRVQKGFMVAVYAEKLAMSVGPMRTVVVVDQQSANPNLRFHQGPPVPTIALDKDHSELVKPEFASDFVVEGLNDLIRRIPQVDGSAFAFDAAASVQGQVARLIYTELFKTSKLLDMSCCRKHTQEGDTEREKMFKVATAMAAASTKDKCVDELLAVTDSLDQAAASGKDRGLLLDGLTRIGCALLLNLWQEDGLASASQEHGLEIGVPELTDEDFLNIAVESLHSSLRGWPVQLKWNPANEKLESNSWRMSPAAVHPSGWGDDDHLHHLVARIRQSSKSLNGTYPSGLKTPWPGAGDPRMGLANDNDLSRALEFLELKFKKQRAIVLDTTGEGNPYGEPAMRKKVGEVFGHLIAMVRPSRTGLSEEMNSRLNTVQVHAQEFLMIAESKLNETPS